MKNLKVRTKIIFSFGLIMFLLLVVIGLTYTQINSYNKIVGRVIDLRIPTVQNSIESINGINHSLAALRGWMLLGKGKFANERKKSWDDEIHVSYKKMKEFSKKWTNPRNVDRLNDVAAMLKTFEDAQTRIMGILTNSRDILNENKMDEAKKILGSTAAPTAFKIKEVLRDMIEDQKGLAAKDSDKSRDIYSMLIKIIIGIALISLIFVIIITVFLVRSITRPLAKVVEVMKFIARGDLTGRVDSDTKDEFGILSDNVNKSVETMHDMISQVIVSARNLVSAVGEISDGNQNLSQRTSEQASSLEEIAATVEETNATTRQNTDNAAEANKLAENSYQLAEEGGRVSTEAVNGINEINELSKKIGDITSVINEISFQTNLLALNAAVEAARAGDAGRGFAVVAGEIRNLAQRSGNAAKEIEQLIKDTIEKIETGSSLVNKSGESLNEIIKGIGEVNRIVNEITAASNEQKQGIEQLTIAVTEMDDMTQQNAALVEETASASEEMSNQAQELLGMTEKFTVNDNIARAAYRQEKIHIAGVEKKPEISKVAAVDKNSGADLKNIMSEDGFEEF